MALRRIMANGGGGSGYIKPSPYIEPIASPDLIDPPQFFGSGYFGMFHIDDVNSSEPITCMRANPNIRTIRALVCTPNKAELERRAELGLKTVIGVVGPVKEIIETQNGNGETVQIAIDENGDPVATKKKPNIMPLVLTAAAALFFLM